MFLQGTDVIFKVALSLLSSHEALILQCDSFEAIVEFVKSTIPNLSHSQMEKTIIQVPATFVSTKTSDRICIDETYLTIYRERM